MFPPRRLLRAFPWSQRSGLFSTSLFILFSQTAVVRNTTLFNSHSFLLHRAGHTFLFLFFKDLSSSSRTAFDIMLYSSSILCLAVSAKVVFGHGLITSPPVRAVGAGMTSACGETLSSQIEADPTSHVEGLPEAAALIPDFDATACNVFLCKGLQFSDNAANVQAFTPGQVVNMLATIPIPHEGPMNVSIIDTKTNTAIGDPLITFDSYADESLASLPANNTDFDVTIPTTLGDACTVAGDCVLQWFWFGTGAQQTYESCVDFTVADGASAAAPVSAPVSESPVAETPAVVEPVAESPAVEVPAVAAPVAEAPAVSTPVTEPVVEAPAVISSTAATSAASSSTPCVGKTTMITVTRDATVAAPTAPVAGAIAVALPSDCAGGANAGTLARLRRFKRTD
ncbi:chitin binding protein [Phlyctema vagabunda]|uniref:Chitin binding protein n=1 Tax=Phlyctema vagabunda TaxID=108571 RepID=A0ABR4PWY7_9HELO